MAKHGSVAYYRSKGFVCVTTGGLKMRYRVSIAPGENASEVASVVACNHGNWFDSVDGVGDNEGIVFIDANEGEDADLIREMAEHESVIDYDTVDVWPENLNGVQDNGESSNKSGGKNQ